jgi:hypothetical protein
MAQVAWQCGIFATREAALTDPQGRVNPYFISRSVIFGELLESEMGPPVGGVPRTSIRVIITTARSNVADAGTVINRDGNPADTDPFPTRTCFLVQNPVSGAYDGSPNPTSDGMTGRFVVFRARNQGNTGEGIATVQADGFVSQRVALRSSGNIGVVSLVRGTDPGLADAGMIPQRNFERDVYPLFTSLYCSTCHSRGQPGFEQSTLRGGRDAGDGGGGVHLDLSGTPDQVYASLMAIDDGAASNCAVQPARLCIASPPDSLVLKKPLRDPAAQAVHALQAFEDTTDPNYQTILQWIEQGASR